MIFAIDASGHMLEAPAAVKRSSSPDGEPRRKKRKTSSDSSMLAALKAILVLMKRKIIVNPKDMIGIVIFNTVRPCFRACRARLLMSGTARG